ncbi:MAG: SDR family NAD(P)-dependent oxidoreductase [Ignavibacteriota bacterium]
MTTMANAQIAIVTGANKGIGKAIVRGLAREGFTVFLGARDSMRGETAARELELRVTCALSNSTSQILHPCGPRGRPLKRRLAVWMCW